MHWFVLALVAGSYLLLRRITHSPFGMVLQSIRENEARTRAIGYPVQHYKIVAVMLSACSPGSPACFTGFRTSSRRPISSTSSPRRHGDFNVLGGIGTLVGPIVGAGFFQLLRELLSRMFGDQFPLSDPARRRVHHDDHLPAARPARLREALAEPLAK